MLMKRMTFASSVPSHVYASLHQLERNCRLCLVGAQQQCVRSVVNDVCGVMTLLRQYMDEVLSSLVGTGRKMTNRQLPWTVACCIVWTIHAMLIAHVALARVKYINAVCNGMLMMLVMRIAHVARGAEYINAMNSGMSLFCVHDVCHEDDSCSTSIRARSL